MRLGIITGWWGVRIYGDASNGHGKPMADYFDELLSDQERDERQSLTFIARMDALAAANEA